MERATLARVYSISDPTAVDDPEYLIGLRSAVSSAISYGIGEIGPSERSSVPALLLSQARRAARNGIDLDIVLRRYFAGYTLLGQFLIEEAEDSGWTSSSELVRLLGLQATLLDTLFATVSKAYAEEVSGYHRSADWQRTEHVRKLLAGELLDAVELGYELDAWHLAAIASGPGAVKGLRDLAAGLNCRLLFVRDDERTAWAWLGSGQKISVREALLLAKSSWPPQTPLAFGEAGNGINGWRLSHRQAIAAMSVARHQAGKVVCYADVALLASALQDELLAGSLRARYLAPLVCERDGGVALRRTLNAYFAAGRNVSSTAAALDVSRQTVSVRLRTVEERIGRPLDGCAAELEVALRLLDMDSVALNGDLVAPIRQLS